MKKIFPLLLIIGGLTLGYFGFTKLDNSTKGIEIGQLEISAEDKESSSMAYVMIGLGVLLVVGGAVQSSKK